MDFWSMQVGMLIELAQPCIAQRMYMWDCPG